MVSKSIDRLRQHKLVFWGLIFVGLLLLAGRSISLRPKDTTSPLFLNEIVAWNSSGLTDEDGDFSDWIELYNPGRQPINLSGFTLTDDANQPQKWSFPDLTLAAGDYLLIYASGKNRRDPDGSLHTNFKLSKAGDFVGLYNILDRRYVDTLTARPHFIDIAYGRYGNAAAPGYLAIPSPGTANIEGSFWIDAVAPVTFSTSRGFYTQPLTISLSTATPDVEIRYTLDGSNPTETHGTPYVQPLPVTSTTILRTAAFKAGFLPAEIQTHSYIFLDDVLLQSNTPQGYPATWGYYPRAFDGHVAGDPVAADYEMDPQVVNPHKQEVYEALVALPTLSLAMDRDHFAEIYANPRRRGIAWERPVSAEIIYPDADRQDFQINGGVRIQGGIGREELIPKHSFRLFFRTEYGAARLEYPFFPESPVTEFDTLILRGGVNRSFVATNSPTSTTYLRDEWLRASQLEMSGLSAHGTFVQLYINGLYWGLYNVTERPDVHFMASYLGGDKDQWLVFNHSGPVDGNIAQIEGLMASFFAYEQDGDDPTIRQDFVEKVLSLVDPVQFSDFVILNWYAGNQDWGENNWYMGVQPANGTMPHDRIIYMVWDGEKTFYNGADIYLGKNKSPLSDVVDPVLELLWQQPDFRMLFADRMYKHLYHEGALTDDRSRTRWKRLAALVDKAIMAESARWGDVRQPQAISKADWAAATQQVLDQMSGNGDRLVELARVQGYYPALDPPRLNQQGGLIPPNFELRMTTSQDAHIFYSLDGSDPRLPGGAISPAAISFKEPLVLTQPTTINSRTYADGTWSALNQAEFHLAERVNHLFVSELMYNPLGGADYEFIELANSGNTPFPLANLAFEGIDYTFQANTPALLPGERIVLVANAAAFSERYPNVAFAGVYQGSLSNAGETITLNAPASNSIFSVSYDDENGWPLSVDGRGDSLILTYSDNDPNQPKSWQASSILHGSPGAADPLEKTVPDQDEFHEN